MNVVHETCGGVALQAQPGSRMLEYIERFNATGEPLLQMKCAHCGETAERGTLKPQAV